MLPGFPAFSFRVRIGSRECRRGMCYIGVKTANSS